MSLIEKVPSIEEVYAALVQTYGGTEARDMDTMLLLERLSVQYWRIRKIEELAGDKTLCGSLGTCLNPQQRGELEVAQKHFMSIVQELRKYRLATKVISPRLTAEEQDRADAVVSSFTQNNKPGG